MEDSNTNDSPVVLLVEDDRVLQKMYTLKFAKEGLNVIPVDTAEAAMLALEEHSVNLIILDVVLPGGVSGIDLLRRIRNIDGYKDLPVLFLTNAADPKLRTQAESMGISEYLVKAMHTPESVVQKVKEKLE